MYLFVLISVRLNLRHANVMGYKSRSFALRVDLRANNLFDNLILPTRRECRIWDVNGQIKR